MEDIKKGVKSSEEQLRSAMKTQLDKAASESSSRAKHFEDAVGKAGKAHHALEKEHKATRAAHDKLVKTVDGVAKQLHALQADQ